MHATLERLDPDSDSIALLVELVEKLRPRRAPDTLRTVERVTALCELLEQHPEHASALRAYLGRLLDTRRHASLYTDIGILSNDGFFTELIRRITYRLLPPALGDVYLSDAIDQVLYVETDHLWISAVPDALWLRLFDLIALAAPRAGAAQAQRTTRTGMLDAIRILSCRVCALGLEPRLIRSHAEIENFDSPFLMQNIEVNQYLDGYERMLTHGDGAPEDARHLLVMLDQCAGVVGKVRKNAARQGTSVALTYLLVALMQSIERLRKLLFLVDVSGTLTPAPALLEAAGTHASLDSPVSASALRRAGTLALARELVQAHNHKYAVADLFADNIDLLARNVTENASRTGEHYVAETRGQLGQMFGASAGAGLIVAIMATIKLLIGSVRAAPLVEAFLFSLNYSLGFIVIHVLHFTIATKQPAMTASRVARGLSSRDGRTIDLDTMADLVNKVFRTQCTAVLGNLATALPTAYLIATGYAWLAGHAMVTPEKAMRLLHEIDPFSSLALFYAAITGVCLFLVGLISGYYDNKAVYTEMAQRVLQRRGLRRLLGPERLLRLSRYLENNLGGLMGNFYFGIMLGTIGTLGFLLGLPLEIRHVTFSSANLAIAFAGLDSSIGWQLAATSLFGVLAIGAVNLLVSFALALWVALRARKIEFEHGMTLLRILGRRLRSAPLVFFIGPRTNPANVPESISIGEPK